MKKGAVSLDGSGTTVHAHSNPSALSRGLSLGKLGLRLTGSYVGYQLQELFLGQAAREKARQQYRKESSRRLREELQSLKGPVMKLGQLLSMQDHILPAELIEELQKLQMEAPGMHPTLAKAQFRSSCGRAPEDVFRQFSPEPFASASLGQVHRALTRKGESVAVKIQYPAMPTAIRNDFKILRTANMTRHIPIDVIDEVERRVVMETDYQNEARNLDFFREALKPLPEVCVPRVHWDLTTDRVLTMSHIEGISLGRYLEQRLSQKARDDLAWRLFELFLYQIYHVRALHADPHPGNYLITEGGRIGLVDFGCVEYFSEPFAELVHGFLHRAWLKPGAMDRMMRLMWAKSVSLTNKRARAILQSEIDLLELIFPPPETQQRIVSFSDPELFKRSMRRNLDILHARLARPEFPFYERAETGLYNYLRQLQAKLDTNSLLASVMTR